MLKEKILLEDTIHLAMAMLSSRKGARPSPEDLQAVFGSIPSYVNGVPCGAELNEFLKQEVPSEFADFTSLAKVVAKLTLKQIESDTPSTPPQNRRAYEEIYEQLIQTETGQQRSSYVVVDLRTLKSLEKFATQSIDAAAPQGLNFTNYIVVPIVDQFIHFGDYTKGVRLLEHYEHSKLLVNGTRAIILEKSTYLFKSAKLVVEDTLPEFRSASDDGKTITRITQYTMEGGKQPTQWLVNSMVDEQPFWGVKTKRFDENSEGYKSGLIKTNSLKDALRLAQDAKNRDKSTYTNSLGVIIDTPSPTPISAKTL